MQVLGTLITEWEAGARCCTQLLESPQVLPACLHVEMLACSLWGSIVKGQAEEQGHQL